MCDGLCVITVQFVQYKNNQQVNKETNMFKDEMGFS
jgi:hypothetical protein